MLCARLHVHLCMQSVSLSSRPLYIAWLVIFNLSASIYQLLWYPATCIRAIAEQQKKIIITDLWLAFHPTTDSGSWTQSQWELSNKSWVKNLLLVTSGFYFSANIIACVRNFFLPLRVGFYTAFRGY